MRLRRTALPLLVLFLSVGCDSTYVVRGGVRGASIDPPAISISGVTSGEGTAVPEVEIGLFAYRGALLRRSISDAKGHYRLSFIFGPSVKGLYVEFRKPGYLVRRVDLSPRPRSGSGIEVRPCPDTEEAVCLGVIDVILELDRNGK